MAKKEPRRVVPFLELPGPELLKTMHEGTELACALTAGAYIENAMGSLLKLAMIDDEKASGENGLLNGPNGILNAAGARADMCYCLGLIDKKTHKNAKTIADIRNKFAHSHKPIGFTTKYVVDQCNALQVIIAREFSQAIEIIDASKEKGMLSSTRVKFVLAAYGTFIEIAFSIFNEPVEMASGGVKFRKRQHPVANCEKIKINTHGLIGDVVLFNK